MLSLLLARIAHTTALNDHDRELCAQAFEPFSLPKNNVTEAAGRVPGHLYFIATGYLRLYFAAESGAEATTHLGGPGEFLTPFLPFIHQQPAPESLASITAVAGLRVSWGRLRALIDASEAFKAFSLLIFEQAMGAAGQRANSLATRSAAQRYADLHAARPDLLLHVPVQYLASYLGIERESLSRIRRQAIR